MRQVATYVAGRFLVLARRNLFLVMEYLPGGDFMSLLECIVQLEEQVSWRSALDKKPDPLFERTEDERCLHF